MPVEGVYNSSAAVQQNAQASGASSTIDMNDFYNLMAAQMKYQDMDNPMDTAEMLNQMVQTQMITAITEMTSMNLTTYATSMTGQTVTVAELDMNGAYTGKNTTGVVEGVILGDDPILFINGNPYSLSQVVSVGTVPEPETDDTTTDGSTEGDDTTTDGTTESEGTETP